MLDLALLAFFGVLLLLGLRHPFIWVLAYLYVDIVSPQRVGWTFVQSLPISLIAFVAAFSGWLLIDRKDGARFTLRQGLMVALLAYCAMTTLTADFPEAALEKWSWVWKALVFAIFLPLTLTTRLRIEGAILFMVLSIAAIIINGGLKTVLGGGGYETLTLLVRENSGLYEGSIISCVAISVIPLILWLARHGTIFPPDNRVRLFAAALIFAALLMPVGTAARTGLLCVGALGALMMRSVKNRFLYMGLAGFLAIAAIPFLPQSFTERMSTIENHQADQSASTRLAVWAWTFDYAKKHPLGGGFNAYLSNKLTFETVDAKTDGSTTTISTTTMTDEARAYHSSYFEMLGEQGWIGLGLWLWLLLLGIWQMEKLQRRWKSRIAEGETWQAPLALALQQGLIVYMVGSLFVGIAFQPFIFMLIGLQCALWSYCRDREPALPSKRARRAASKAAPTSA
ncbi:MAG: putative O-glycosylation ligase, exosortase A system-associated [Novosphingobium sp.]|uniref:putative O-glycosylation ligase, exosortase A system-associated n=1 Tax=Tsuneonella sp. CC-YZS046 TaxID=3042152 RepID=UPI002D77BAED|nr:putative O-glycosylation ligase, exosortase A system-associated [Tsuneonella sp. CC-YZS046]WRO66306.1 putative O-glycosylation ligase, exosortase A system-associated [Tsuneonella sp. CC-YZS046]